MVVPFWQLVSHGFYTKIDEYVSFRACGIDFIEYIFYYINVTINYQNTKRKDDSK